MQVLIYGGTRFIGKKVVDSLLRSGHKLTLISRHEPSQHENLISIKGEREDCYTSLVHTSFDCILDFMAYDVKAVKEAVSIMPNTPYIFISTAWIDFFNTGLRRFLSFEENYVRRKIEAEAFLENIHQNGKKIIICRLPITLGADDHSERFKFYTTRLLTNKSLILPGVGTSKTSIAFRDDVCAALSALVERNDSCKEMIFDVLPKAEISLTEYAKLIAKGLGIKANLLNLEPEFIAESCPGYLDIEPLWREGTYSKSYPNLFEKMQIPVATYQDWIFDLCKLPEMIDQSGRNAFLQSDILLREKKFLECQW